MTVPPSLLHTHSTHGMSPSSHMANDVLSHLCQKFHLDSENISGKNKKSKNKRRAIPSLLTAQSPWVLTKHMKLNFLFSTKMTWHQCHVSEDQSLATVTIHGRNTRPASEMSTKSAHKLWTNKFEDPKVSNNEPTRELLLFTKFPFSNPTTQQILLELVPH